MIFLLLSTTLLSISFQILYVHTTVHMHTHTHKHRLHTVHTPHTHMLQNLYTMHMYVCRHTWFLKTCFAIIFSLTSLGYEAALSGL